MNKDPVITKIEFNEKEKEEIRLLAKGEMISNVKTRVDKFGNEHEIVYQRRSTYSTARRRLNELYGGMCTTCRNWPEWKVRYNVSDKNQGAWLVERYCQACFDRFQGVTNWKKKKKN